MNPPQKRLFLPNPFSIVLKKEVAYEIEFDLESSRPCGSLPDDVIRLCR